MTTVQKFETNEEFIIVNRESLEKSVEKYKDCVPLDCLVGDYSRISSLAFALNQGEVPVKETYFTDMDTFLSELNSYMAEWFILKAVY